MVEVSDAVAKLKAIEVKWQTKWEKMKLHESNIVDWSHKGLLVTFPYPYLNGALHCGHGFTASKVDFFARFKRLQGFNVLFPFAFHATGEPIVGVAKRVRQKDASQIKALRLSGIPENELSKFTDPEYVASYWREKAILVAKKVGWSIDWRRQFITIEPLYKKFIEWQYLTLRELGYVKKGTHNVVYCPSCQSPTGDHDRLTGEGATVIEFNLVKFPVVNQPSTFLVAAT